jgi:hypothetical protein
MALFVLALCSCKEGGGGLPDLSGSGSETRFLVVIAPERAVDILFMVDNSPSMDPKQEALAKAFPKMIESFQKLPSGPPDLHIGVVSSDMGAGGGESPGGCSSVLGNQGILWGNDPNANPDDQNNKYATVKNIKNGCGMNSGARWIEDIQKPDAPDRSRNYTGDLTNVFSCLAKAVGVGGCGYEHQLQSVRLALNPAENINPQNFKFVRPRAYLAVVLISDEDDCSADPSSETNGGMFFPRTKVETGSLRCAARGHACNGKDIPNYDPNTGYMGAEPFVAKFSDCDAKDDSGSKRDYDKLPLIRVRDMVDSVQQVKQRPSEQILAAGIIGWPQDGNLDGVEYRIDKDGTSQPVDQQKLWDYLPICKIPDQKSADGNIYKAYGGLRLKKFIDGLKKPDETNVFSLCNPDFSDALGRIATALGKRIAPGCIHYPLVDVDANRPGLQAECIVNQMLSCDTPGQGGCLTSGYQETMIPQCWDGQGYPLDPENPQVETVSAEARPCWYLRRDVSDLGCTQTPWSVRPLLLTRDGGALPPGSLLQMSCLTCTDGQGGCQADR